MSTKILRCFFRHSRSCGYLLNVEPINLMFLKTYNTYNIKVLNGITITFTDQNGRPLEAEDKFNLTLLNKIYRWYVFL